MTNSAQSLFEVGDKVRVLVDYQWFRKGDIHEVVLSDVTDRLAIKNPKTGGFWSFHWTPELKVELISRKEETMKVEYNEWLLNTGTKPEGNPRVKVIFENGQTDSGPVNSFDWSMNLGDDTIVTYAVAKEDPFKVGDMVWYLSSHKNKVKVGKVTRVEKNRIYASWHWIDEPKSQGKDGWMSPEDTQRLDV